MSEAILPVLGVMVPAFAVWVAVRIVNRGKKQGKRFWLTVFLAAALVTYSLSVGPAMWLADNIDFISDEQLNSTVDFIYAPLDWLSEQSPPFAAIYRRYLSLWIHGGGFGPDGMSG